MSNLTKNNFKIKVVVKCLKSKKATLKILAKIRKMKTRRMKDLRAMMATKILTLRNLKMMKMAPDPFILWIPGQKVVTARMIRNKEVNGNIKIKRRKFLE